MATLTYTERLNVQNGSVKPPDMSLATLIGLIAKDYAIEFREAYKEFDSATYPLAEQYKSKLFNLCSQVLNYEKNRDAGLLNSFMTDFITLLGRTAYTYAQLTTATQSQWENFVKTGNPASAVGYAGIRLLFEAISNTTKEAKAEYELLP
jgi:hypothetical protein